MLSSKIGLAWNSGNLKALAGNGVSKVSWVFRLNILNLIVFNLTIRYTTGVQIKWLELTP